MVVELVAGPGVAAAVVDAAPAHRSLEARLGRLIGLDTDDGLDPRLVCGPIEIENPVHVPVIGDPDRRLTVRHRPGDDLGNPGRTVEHRELGVLVQMGERCAHGRFPPPS